MRQRLTILLLFFVTDLYGQRVDKTFIDRWIRSCDSGIEVDSVRAYYIDGHLIDAIDTSKLNSRLRAIPIEQIRSIWYSKIKTDNYVPGKGTIHILTIKKKDTKNATSWLKSANELFTDKYISNSQHILTDSKDPVLVIDGQAILPSIAKGTLERINATDIYDISVNDSFPVPSDIYGQNAKNGLVQIWTKQKFRK